MRRKLTLTMLLTLSAVSPQAVSLGLGEVEVHSSLNAPLRATIPLTDTAGMEPDRLNVSVAEAGAFQAAGLSRTPLAASVGLAVREHQGQLMLDLTSSRAIREPWLDLMLRFDWPGGQSLREVTLLLDPPNYDQLPVLAGAAAATRAAASQATSPPSSPTLAAPARPAERPTARGQGGGEAWVGSGDTLWSVASRLRPDSSISMDQMMVALVQANPDVFPSGNINAMRAGHTLTVPSREAIAARSAEEAASTVQAMNRAWANRGSGAPARVPLDTGAEPPTAVASVPIETEPRATGAATQADAPVAGGADPEIAEANGGESPRLTLLTDAQVAAETAESVVADTTAPERDAPGSVGLDPEVLASLGAEGLIEPDEAHRLARLERRWLESREALEAVQQERDALQDQVSGLREEVDILRDQLVALLAGGAGEDGPGTGGVVPPGSAPADDADAPWWGAVYPAQMDRNLVLGAAGVAGLLGLWLLIRRRRHGETHHAADFATMPHGAHGATPTTVSAPTQAAPGVSSASASTSTVEPPVVPGMIAAAPGSSAMPRAEAISEADIFMAYGRYDQARDVLLAGLAREPGREDLRLKLLIAYQEQGDWQAAQVQAERLRESHDPAIRAEVDRLMASRRPESEDEGSASQGSADQDGPPIADEPAHDAADVMAQASSGLERDHARFPVEGESEHLAPEPPEALYGEKDADHGETPEPDDAQTAGEYATREGVRGGEAAEGEAEQPPLGRQQSAPEVIDYQPPPLDPEPAARQETPMQPSIEFTSGDSGSEDVPVPEPEIKSESQDIPGRVPEGADDGEWDVEEVAFPPLDPDNDGLRVSPGHLDDLDEARRLLEVGETERARRLLEPLLDSAEDPRLRMQARELIDHYRL
ncbi:hypothetical protein HOP52_00745 [Halomonas campisalis]|uniref:FimV N-terminal domain-containing protein n=1 Tax=Billgrantia campisalis TaxID=74661 RepID=A0ABS9P3E4_9GAMM|nr:FimV/HubP family polar landmark protein [Halomonas campisalis]MCG6656305.1 hypothetical protein [Halomonas campisalis]MDR5861491.1 FimV/HubP family polar landmark protein [Halomonas campisalis]